MQIYVLESTDFSLECAWLVVSLYVSLICMTGPNNATTRRLDDLSKLLGFKRTSRRTDE